MAVGDDIIIILLLYEQYSVHYKNASVARPSYRLTDTGFFPYGKPSHTSSWRMRINIISDRKVDIVETDILWYVNISSCETLVFPGE
jgi:hypothetical protein